MFLDSTHSSESSMDLNTGLWAQRTSLCAWNRDPSSDISSTSLRLGLLMYDARSNSGSARRQEREKWGYVCTIELILVSNNCRIHTHALISVTSDAKSNVVSPFSSSFGVKFFGGKCLRASMSVVLELKVFLSRGSAPSLIRHATVTRSCLWAARWRTPCVCVWWVLSTNWPYNVLSQTAMNFVKYT